MQLKNKYCMSNAFICTKKNFREPWAMIYFWTPCLVQSTEIWNNIWRTSSCGIPARDHALVQETKICKTDNLLGYCWRDQTYINQMRMTQIRLWNQKPKISEFTYEPFDQAINFWLLRNEPNENNFVGNPKWKQRHLEFTLNGTQGRVSSGTSNIFVVVIYFE